MADDLEQREVLVAVGVEVAPGKVDAVLAGERPGRQRLPAAPARRPDVPPREPAVLHLELRAEDVRDAELPRQGLDLVAGGGRHEGEGVPAAAVGLHQRARLGVDHGGDRAREDALAELLELPLGDVAQPGCRRRDEPRETDAPELEADRVGESVGDVARAHPSGEEPVAHEGHRREAGDQRPVDVKERGDPGALGTLLDLVREPGVECHAARHRGPGYLHAGPAVEAYPDFPANGTLR